MNKEQAIQALASHLEMLVDYDVLEVNLAETLHVYISEIINEIDEDKNKTNIDNVVEIWSTLKDSKKDDGFGEDFQKD